MIIYTHILALTVYSFSFMISTHGTPTMAPTSPCQNVISFMSNNNQIVQNVLCYNFTYSANAGTLQLCGYNSTSGKPMGLFNKNGGFSEQGIGLAANKNHEIPIGGMIQINMASIKTKTIPTFNMGSTGSLNVPQPVLGYEWFCLYGSNTAGVRGADKDKLYSGYREAVDIPFPTNYSRYKYVSFTACRYNKNPAADVLIQTITITDGWACTNKPTYVSEYFFLVLKLQELLLQTTF